MKVTVEKPEDWTQVAQIGGPVVDPMIVRCGDLFLQGASGVADPAAALDLLTRNLNALGLFFDRLILDDRIPVFNYADTFDIGQNFDQRAVARVNATEEILVDVDIQNSVYWQAKEAALTELRKLYQSGPRIDAQQAYNILGELAGAGYAWYPDLGGLQLPNQDEERLAAFILGGLIFGSYAQQAGADHLMQPKRSRLFLAISLQQDASRKAEEILFEKLGTLVAAPTAKIPYTPTFFPLLLHTSHSPAQMVENVIKMRNSGEVLDYRLWLKEALDDFNRDGCIPLSREREVKRIADHIQAKIDGMPFPKVEFKTTAVDILAAKLPGIGIDLTAPIKAAWGWTIDQLPGRRHRKLLTRAVIADHEYKALNRRVETVWKS